jgi:hypothetical protein
LSRTPGHGSPGRIASEAGLRSEAMALRLRVREGEIGCIFDEIQNLVEPIERPQRGESHAVNAEPMEGSAGPQRNQIKRYG